LRRTQADGFPASDKTDGVSGLPNPASGYAANADPGFAQGLPHRLSQAARSDNRHANALSAFTLQSPIQQNSSHFFGDIRR
jgi:hypothetical protein